MSPIASVPTNQAAADGREGSDVLPLVQHGHLSCRRCGAESDLAADDPAVIAAVAAFDTERGFEIDRSHLSLIGRCAGCRDHPEAATPARS